MKIDQILKKRTRGGGDSSGYQPPEFFQSEPHSQQPPLPFVDLSFLSDALGKPAKRQYKKRGKKDADSDHPLCETHEYPITILLHYNSDFDPQLDILSHKEQKVDEIYRKFQEKKDIFSFIKYIIFQIEYKDIHNSNQADPYMMRPNYHIHICIEFQENNPVYKFQELFFEHIGIPYQKLTYDDKRYPWRNIEYVFKEYCRHKPRILVWDESITDIDKYIEEKRKLFHQYPISKQDIYTDKEDKLLGDKEHKYWNAIFTTRTFFSKKYIYIEEKQQPYALTFYTINEDSSYEYLTVKDILYMMAMDPSFRFHLAHRVKQYSKLLNDPKEIYTYLSYFINVVD